MSAVTPGVVLPSAGAYRPQCKLLIIVLAETTLREDWEATSCMLSTLTLCASATV